MGLCFQGVLQAYLATHLCDVQTDVGTTPRTHCTTLVIARIRALSSQALAYILQAVLNAAIGSQALHLLHPKHMLKGAVTMVQRTWAIHGQGPRSLPAQVFEALAPYYGDGTNYLVHSAYTAQTAARLHRLMHNQEPEVREVFTLTLQEAQHQRNMCPQYILHQPGLPTRWEHEYGTTYNSCYRTKDISFKRTTGARSRAP